jgi:PhnB protein
MATASRIAPLLSVRDGAAAIEFYKQAFGVQERFRVDDERGAVVATLGLDDVEFWVADESPENANFSPETIGGSTARMILYVEDPDTVFACAVEAGAREVLPVSNQHGWRIGRVEDPFWQSLGNLRTALRIAWKRERPVQPNSYIDLTAHFFAISLIPNRSSTSLLSYCAHSSISRPSGA